MAYEFQGRSQQYLPKSPPQQMKPAMPPTLTENHPPAISDRERDFSIATYPSADGSPIHRTSSFWTLPWSFLAATGTLASSMDVGRSEMSCCEQGLNVLLDYGSEGRRREILERESKWLIETLHPKVVAVEAAFRKYEQALALGTSTSGPNNASYESHHHPHQPITATATATAAKRADETMRAHHLRVEAIAFVSPPSSGGYHGNISNHQRARYSWTMYYAVSGGGGNSGSSAATHHGHELVVGRGLVDTEEELYTAEFWTARRKTLEV